MNDKIIKYFKYGNILKTTIVVAIVLIVLSYLFYRHKKTITNIISAMLVMGAVIMLFSNNFIKQGYKMENEIKPYRDIEDRDKTRILENYAIIKTTEGAEKPTTWWEDGDYNVDNNLVNYRIIEIDTAFIVHKRVDGDVTILQFYAYYTKNGESTIEGSSHIHDFSKYYLYFYENETRAFAIGFSSYNYELNKHEWVYREYIEYIDRHEILIHDVSTNEYMNEEIDYSDHQITEKFSRYEWNPREMNRFEIIVFAIILAIWLCSTAGLMMTRGSGWVFLIIVFGLFMIYFPIRTQSVYLTEFKFYFYDSDETPSQEVWEGGESYVEMYGGAPHLRDDWNEYTISDQEELYDIYKVYTMG